MSDGPLGGFETTGMMMSVLKYSLLISTQAIDGGKEGISLSKVAQKIGFTEGDSKDRSARFYMDGFTDRQVTTFKRSRIYSSVKNRL